MTATTHAGNTITVTVVIVHTMIVKNKPKEDK